MKQFNQYFRICAIIAALLISNISTAQWIQTAGAGLEDYGEAIAATSDGGVITVGYTNSYSPADNKVLVTKYDENGNVDWSRARSGSGGYAIIQTMDGGYLVLTGTFSVSNVGIHKLDPLGEYEWYRELDYTNIDRGRGILQEPDGSYLILTTASDPGASCFLTRITGPTGPAELVYSRSGVFGLRKTRLIRDHSEGFVIAGTLGTGSGGEFPFITRLAADFNLISQSDISQLISAQVRDIQLTQDGGYMVVGRRYTSDMFIAKFDSDLNPIWNKRWEADYFEELTSIISMDDGTFMVAGYVSDEHANNRYGANAFWMRIDDNGDAIWTRSFGEFGERDHIEWGVKTVTGNYAFAGTTTSIGAGRENQMTIMVDAEGLEVDPNGCAPIYIESLQNYGERSECQMTFMEEVGYAVEATSNCVTDPTLDYVLEIDYNNNGSVDLIENVSEYFSDFWPGGRHKMTFTVTDQCCSTEEVVVYIEVQEDILSPIAICDADIVVEVFADSTSTLTPFDVDDGSWDDCGAFDLGVAVIPFSQLGIDPASLTYASSLDFTVLDIGVYAVILEVNDHVNPPTYCWSTLTITANTSIEGYIVQDADGNCEPNIGEQGLSGWLIEAEGATQTYYGYSDDQGAYKVLVDTGQYTVRSTPPINYWQNCVPSSDVHVENYGETELLDLAEEVLIDCPYLTVDLSTPFLRRCFSNTIYVDYCNDGSAVAEDAYIVVTLNPNMNIDSVSMGYSYSQSGDEYTFQLGDIEIGTCEKFKIHITLDCDAALGSTICTRAEIFPDENCELLNPLWDESSIEVAADCDGDSIHFEIRNIGIGDMLEQQEYVIIQDAVMLNEPEPFQLLAGTALEYSLDAEGFTYRLEANQATGHPGFSRPSVTVEGCDEFGDGTISLGFVNMLGEDDADGPISIDCQEVVGAYDPNDKQAYPKGFDAAHYIKKDEDLEYKIRFQNTGTDTAFRVVVVDTLSELLDITTIKPGASSHDYVFDILGDNILRFTFDNILLPDSTANEPGSHGFVKFQILQSPTNEIGDIIYNDAAIYFDFNEPIITNRTFHTLGNEFIPTSLPDWNLDHRSFSVMPNPSAGVLDITIDNSSYQTINFRLVDILGNVIQEDSFDTNNYRLDEQQIEGIYFVELSIKGQLVGTKKILFY